MPCQVLGKDLLWPIIGQGRRRLPQTNNWLSRHSEIIRKWIQNQGHTVIQREGNYRTFHVIFSRLVSLIYWWLRLIKSEFHDKKLATFYMKEEKVERLKKDKEFMKLFEITVPKPMRNKVMPPGRNWNMFMPDRNICTEQDDNIIFSQMQEVRWMRGFSIASANNTSFECRVGSTNDAETIK